MTDLQYLANAINRIIGTKDYVVYLNTNGYPKSDGKIVVTFSATRVPFGFTTKEIDAESLLATLTFDLTAADIPRRDQTLFVIKNTLLGWRSFKLTQPDGAIYSVECFLQQQAPSNPYIDSGGITQQIVVSGNILVSNASCKAIVGNHIGIYIDDEKLLKSQRILTGQAAAENNLPLSENSMLPEIMIVSHTHNTQLTCIYTGKGIEKEFLKIGEGAAQDANKIHILRVEYPDFSVSVNIKITGVTVTDNAGTFLQYTLFYQTTEEAVIDE